MFSMYDYKRYANISDSDQDGKISAAVKAATSVAQRYTGLTFDTGNKTAVLNPSSTGYLVLPDTNVKSITSITFAGLGDLNTTTNEYDDLVLDAASYYLDFVGVIEIVGAVTMPTTNRSITVVYEKEDTVPDDLKLAVYELTQYYFKREFNYDKVIGGESVDFKDNSILPTQVKTILDMHRCL